jgi:aryl-alcohol dehydrogenase-like predicted oxidoreductase
MNHRTLGRTGLRVSELCFGTMTFGGEGVYTAIGSTAQAEADRLVGVCLELGINFFDTADVYSAGRAEEIVGKALGTPRKDVVLATKARWRTGPGPNAVGLSRGHVMDAVDAS